MWKLNNSLLQDLSFRETIRKYINDHLRYEHVFPNAREWWDFLKWSLKEISLNYAKKKRAEANREKVSLTNKLASLKRKLATESVETEIVECEALIEQELAGAKVRSRVKWIEVGEKPTSFSFRLERNQDQKHFVPSILD